jgi:predicted GNAT superfamily acetyltransferase
MSRAAGHRKRSELKIAIEPFRHAADYAACAEIQREVWRFSDIDIVPTATLKVLGEYGGILLGAYNSIGEMVGFVASFLGQDEGDLIQHSHMLAVRAAYRNFDVAFKLKLMQRKEALRRKIRTIHWTFDPMQPVNAYFNLGKLGASTRDYREDYYGESSSVLHRGFPTDRFVTHWELESRSVRTRLDEGPPRHDLQEELERYPLANSLVEVGPMVAASSPLKLDLGSAGLLFEVPHNLPDIKTRNAAVALEWLGRMRQLFRTCFAKGYAATDFWTADDDGRPRAFYFLQKLKA